MQWVGGEGARPRRPVPPRGEAEQEGKTTGGGGGAKPRRPVSPKQLRQQKRRPEAHCTGANLKCENKHGCTNKYVINQMAVNMQSSGSGHPCMACLKQERDIMHTYNCSSDAPSYPVGDPFRWAARGICRERRLDIQAQPAPPPIKGEAARPGVGSTRRVYTRSGTRPPGGHGHGTGAA